METAVVYDKTHSDRNASCTGDSAKCIEKKGVASRSTNVGDFSQAAAVRWLSEYQQLLKPLCDSRQIVINKENVMFRRLHFLI
jgi:hypothetical protein